MNNARILDLLAQGINPVQVLTIVGCSPAYLKELLSDTEFSKELEAKQKEYFSEADEEEIIVNRHLALEHKILKQIEAQIGNAELRDTLKALETIGNRQERIKSRQSKNANAASGASRAVVNVVNLVLPQHAIPEYTLNSNKEVVSIGDRTLTPMTGDNVKKLFNSMQDSNTKLAELGVHTI